MVLDYEDKYRDILCDIFFDIYTNPPFSYTWLVRDNVERYIQDMERTPNFLGFIYVYNNEVSGGCLGIVNDYFKNTSYRISEIFINRKYQNIGLGSDFLDKIQGLINNKNIKIIELSTEKHTNAYNFYLKNGFLVSKNINFLIKPIKI